MNKILLIVSAFLLLVSNQAIAAKQTLTSTDTGAQSRTKLNSNFTELYNGKADASCFATESAFNACFDLTWSAGGSMSWPASDGAYYAAKDGAWASLATVYQPLDSDLTTFSGLACTEGQIPKKNSSSVWVCGSDVEGEGGGISHATSDGNYYASRNGAWANIATAFATVASTLVGDCTVGPCLDGTSDGGTLIKLYGPGGYWQALQAGNSVANRSWRLMIGAPPSAGTTTLLNVDEYGQMGQVATSTYLTPSGVGGSLTVTATGFDGNLATTDNTIQEIAQKFDDYTGGGSMTWPAAAGIMVYGGSSSYGTSLVADGDAIGEVVVVQDDGGGNPELPFTIDLSVLTDTTGILTGKLSVSAIDDAPVNAETAAPISSNWAYDHAADATAHGSFQAADADLDDLADGTLGESKIDSAIARDSEVNGSKTGVHATPSTTTPLSPTWTGLMHTVWYGATGTINLPVASGYADKGILIYNTGAFTITIDANGSEVIVRDGTAQTGGVSMTLSSGAGNYVALVSDGARWVTVGYKGTLAAGS